MAAKQGEAQLASQLGYNPYETARANAGQARSANTIAQHGNISADQAGDHLPTVAPPRDATVPEVGEISDLPFDLQHAFAALSSSGEDAMA